MGGLRPHWTSSSGIASAERSANALKRIDESQAPITIGAHNNGNPKNDRTGIYSSPGNRDQGAPRRLTPRPRAVMGDGGNKNKNGGHRARHLKHGSRHRASQIPPKLAQKKAALIRYARECSLADQQALCNSNRW